jgi:hypothetical protein
MQCAHRVASWRRSVLSAALVSMCSLPLAAADRNAGPREKSPPAESVEMFSGIEQGQIDVQFIPRDASRGQLLIENKTDRPLSVRLPASFAAVPVLAQFPPGPQRRQMPPVPPIGPPPTQANQPNTQRVGGGNGQFPFFDIAPERVAQIKVDTVCLDHGKPNPRPAVKYQVQPVAEVTDKQGVAEVCELLGRGEIGHQAAQLAAWHFSNDMSWEKLADLREKAAFGKRPSYTKKEIEAAKKAAEKALDLAKSRKQPSTAEQVSAGR